MIFYNIKDIYYIYMLDLHLNHYFSTPLGVAQSIRQCLRILGNYNTLKPEPAYGIFMKMKEKINKLEESEVEKTIYHQQYLYEERQVNTYHRKLEEYATALRDVLEMSETELTDMTNFTKEPDSQGWKVE